jgi:hypothetical protein
LEQVLREHLHQPSFYLWTKRKREQLARLLSEKSIAKWMSAAIFIFIPMSGFWVRAFFLREISQQVLYGVIA